MEGFFYAIQLDKVNNIIEKTNCSLENFKLKMLLFVIEATPFIPENLQVSIIKNYDYKKSICKN